MLKQTLRQKSDKVTKYTELLQSSNYRWVTR